MRPLTSVTVTHVSTTYVKSKKDTTNKIEKLKNYNTKVPTIEYFFY